MEFNPFERPLEYYGHGDRVVIVGDETFKIKATGVTHRAAWAWVVQLRRDGLISRILHVQDLPPARFPSAAGTTPAGEEVETCLRRPCCRPGPQ